LSHLIGPSPIFLEHGVLPSPTWKPRHPPMLNSLPKIEACFVMIPSYPTLPYPTRPRLTWVNHPSPTLSLVSHIQVLVTNFFSNLTHKTETGTASRLGDY
jgi:hypothetical protein